MADAYLIRSPSRIWPSPPRPQPLPPHCRPLFRQLIWLADRVAELHADHAHAGPEVAHLRAGVLAYGCREALRLLAKVEGQPSAGRALPPPADRGSCLRLLQATRGTLLRAAALWARPGVGPGGAFPVAADYVARAVDALRGDALSLVTARRGVIAALGVSWHVFGGEAEGGRGFAATRGLLSAFLCVAELASDAEDGALT